MGASMFLMLLLLMQVPTSFKPGRFYDVYAAKDHGVSVEIRRVRDNPRCRHLDNCPWVLLWSTNKRAKEAVIEVTLAGMDFPRVRAWVPAGKDRHNPIFSGEAGVVDGREVVGAPLREVTLIEVTLLNGTKEVRRATFR